MMSALGNINSYFLIQTGCRGRRPIIRKKLYRIKKFFTLPLGLQMILICSFFYIYIYVLNITEYSGGLCKNRLVVAVKIKGPKQIQYFITFSLRSINP